MHKLNRYRQLSDQDFLHRSEQYAKKKEDKIMASQSMKQLQELDQCTFQPDRYATRANNESRPRNVNQFIKDQEKYLEYKNLNSRKAQQEKLQKEKEVHTRKPQVDNLSKQIVDLMHERRDENTHERLYKLGKEKLQATTKDAMLLNSQSMRELERTNKSIRASSAFALSPTRPRGAKQVAESLYQLNKVQKDKISKKRQD